jgi:hypothetical protein
MTGWFNEKNSRESRMGLDVLQPATGTRVGIVPQGSYSVAPRSVKATPATAPAVRA